MNRVNSNKTEDLQQKGHLHHLRFHISWTCKIYYSLNTNNINPLKAKATVCQ